MLTGLTLMKNGLSPARMTGAFLPDSGCLRQRILSSFRGRLDSSGFLFCDFSVFSHTIDTPTGDKYYISIAACLYGEDSVFIYTVFRRHLVFKAQSVIFPFLFITVAKQPECQIERTVFIRVGKVVFFSMSFLFSSHQAIFP